GVDGAARLGLARELSHGDLDAQGVGRRTYVAPEGLGPLPHDDQVAVRRAVEERRDHDDAGQQQQRDRRRDLEASVARTLDELAPRNDRPQAPANGHRATSRRKISDRLGRTTLKCRTDPAARAASSTSDSLAPSSSTIAPSAHGSTTRTPRP